MQNRYAITDAREFAERVWISDECKALAEAHPDLGDFWEHCERGDCMLTLLEATGYQNADKVWKFLEVIREEQKRKKGDANLEQWRENLYTTIREHAEEVEEAERKGYAVPGYARRAKWVSAYVWSDYYAQDIAQREKADAGFKAGIQAAISGNNESESHEAFNVAARAAFVGTMKQQADLLREMLGNPFHRRSGEEFG